MDVEPVHIDIDEYNDKIADWGSRLGSKIRSSIPRDSGDLQKSFRLRTAKYYGEIDKLSYHFLRHGVFEHKGVGRGYRMVGGRVMRVSGSLQSQFVKEYAKQKNRVIESKVLTLETMKRKAVEWFNPIVSENMESLADLVAQMDADKVINATKVLIR